MSTSIQWTDVTDNIIVVEGGGWWCRMISEGCVNCYAAKLNMSDYFGGNKLPYTGDPPKLKLRTEVIDGWSRQTKSKKHFVASMTDVFGDWVPFEWVWQFLSAMKDAPKQTFQVLTKRPDIARKHIVEWLACRVTPYTGETELPANIWIGTSVENQKRADERIPELLKIPARVRFLSVEPMLEAINFGRHLIPNHFPLHNGPSGPVYKPEHIPIHWVIFGGESGHGARPCNIDSIRDGVKQCRAAGVAPFVKQLGANVRGSGYCVHSTDGEGTCPVNGRGKCEGLKDKKGGDITEFPKDLQVREFPKAA